MPSSSAENSSIVRAAVVLAILGPILALFGKVFWNDEVFAFRDAANFYYPLFEWQCAEWSQGRIPLWNPHDDLGTPVLADATSSVLYPGKLIFILPLHFATRFNLYIVLHVLLAAWGAYRLARCWRLSVGAAGLCAVSYAFSGNVLFQYCNIVFLVSAAWLPWAFLYVQRTLIRRRWRQAVAAGGVLALMTLGGDPQMAYNVFLLGGLLGWMLYRHSRRRKRIAAFRVEQRTRSAKLVRSRPVLIAVVGVAWFALAAVQILPSMEWTRHSDRATFYEPRSIYEVADYLMEIAGKKRQVPADLAVTQQISRGLFGIPRRDDHGTRIYLFSVGPWRWPELIWPNISGRMFPRNERWLSRLHVETSVWTPSLYAGLLPVSLALASLIVRTRRVLSRWLKWTFYLSLLGGCGWYGLGWAAEQLYAGVTGELPRNFSMGPATGGVYWFLVLAVPGYAYFRYPAKLLVLTALSMSLLAAYGFDRVRRTGTARVQVGLVAIVGVSLLLLGGIVIWRSAIEAWFLDAPPSGRFGPLDVSKAWQHMAASLVHVVIVALGAWIAFRVWWRRTPEWVAAGILLLTAVEIVTANQWFIATVPAGTMSPPPLPREIAVQGEAKNLRVLRALNSAWRSAEWAKVASDNRHEEIVDWEQFGLLQKYHLQYPIGVLDAPTTLQPREYRALLEIARQKWRSPQGQKVLEQILSADLLLDTGRTQRPDEAMGAVFKHGPFFLRKVAQGESPSGSRAQIRFHLIEWPKVESNDRGELLSKLNEFWNRSAAELADNHAAKRRHEATDCEIVVDEPQRVEVLAELTQPGWLVLNDLFYPGWGAEVTDLNDENEVGKPTSIDAIDYFKRGVRLPAGKHRVVFRYQPARLYTGAVISFLSIVSAGALCLADRRRRS